MYRFGFDQVKKRRINSLLISAVLFIVLFGFFLYLITGISKDTTTRQEQALNDALNRAIVSCYSIEGTYPPSLDYIVRHYGLIYDSRLFFIDYRPIGSNIYPEVTVIRKEKD